MNRVSVFFVLVFAFLVAFDSASADPFTIDASHSNITFGIRHIFTQVNGRFTKFRGTVEYGAKDLSKFAVDLTVTTSSVTTDNERRDADLRNSNFFFADSFPTITFKSIRAFKNEKGLFVEGNLTIRGITKSITAPFEVLGVAGEPGKLVAGFVSSFKINRKDFGIIWNKTIDEGGMLLGDEVEIHIGIEARYNLQ